MTDTVAALEQVVARDRDSLAVPGVERSRFKWTSWATSIAEIIREVS